MSEYKTKNNSLYIKKQKTDSRPMTSSENDRSSEDCLVSYNNRLNILLISAKSLTKNSNPE